MSCSVGRPRLVLSLSLRVRLCNDVARPHPNDFIPQVLPDTLNDLDERTFVDGLAATRSPVKAALMDERRWAGIGNLYADEALPQARTRPSTPSDRIGPRQVRRLYESVKEVLRTAVALDADFDAYPDGYLLTGRSPDTPCPRCGTGLRSTKVGGRTTIYCGTCQKR